MIRPSAPCSSSASSVHSGFTRRVITKVLPRPIAMIELSSPHAWNPGAASTTLRPARSGIFDR